MASAHVNPVWPGMNMTRTWRALSMLRSMRPGSMLAIILFLLSSVALAADFNYRLEIIGADDQETAITKQLDFPAAKDSSLEQLQRLHAHAPDAIRELYATLGYFNAQVQGELVEEDGVWVARYTIDPQQQATISAVDIEFSGDINQDNTRRQQLLASWPLVVGHPFTQAAWREAKKNLLADLSAKRYLQTVLQDSSATVADDGLSVSLQLLVNSGPNSHFGVLKISGLSRYPASVVRNLSTIKEGSPFDLSKVQDFQARLQASGYFASVVIEPVKRSDNPAIVDISVQVSEAKTIRARVGVGYSTDTYASYQLNLDHYNLFNDGLHGVFTLTADSIKQEADTSIKFPVTGQGYFDTLGHAYLRQNTSSEIQPQNVEKNTHTLSHRYFVQRSWDDNRLLRSITLSYLTEYDHVTQAPVGTSDIPQVVEDSHLVTLAADYSWKIKAVNDLLFPSAGHVWEYQFSYGSPLHGAPFARVHTRFTQYFSVSKNWVTIARAEAGYLSGNTLFIPSPYLFVAGGDNSVRGYTYNSLGVPANDTALGSRALALASLEQQYWFTEKWGADIFWDGASVGDHFATHVWYPGYGFGARWRSPVGPLGLDWAWGNRVHTYMFHFSIGFAF